MAEPMEWARRAKCAGLDTEAFYPSPGRNGAEVHRTKRFCSDCPVRADCLDHALSLPPAQDHGIWGGTSVYEREKLRAARDGYGKAS